MVSSPVSGQTYPTYRPSKHDATVDAKKRKILKDLYSQNAVLAGSGGRVSSSSTTARYTGGVGPSRTTFSSSTSGGGGGGAKTTTVSTPTLAPAPVVEAKVLTPTVTTAPSATYTYKTLTGAVITTSSPTARVPTSTGYQSISKVGTRVYAPGEVVSTDTTGARIATGVTTESGKQLTGYLSPGATVTQGKKATSVSPTTAKVSVSPALLAASSTFTQNVLEPTKTPVSAPGVSADIQKMFQTGQIPGREQSFLPPAGVPLIITSPAQLKDNYLTGQSPDARSLKDEFPGTISFLPSTTIEKTTTNVQYFPKTGQLKETPSSTIEQTTGPIVFTPDTITNIQIPGGTPVALQPLDISKLTTPKIEQYLGTTSIQPKQEEYKTTMPVIVSGGDTGVAMKEIKTNIPIDLTKGWTEIPTGYIKETYVPVKTSKTETAVKTVLGMPLQSIPGLGQIYNLFATIPKSELKQEIILGEKPQEISRTIPGTQISIPFTSKEISLQEAEKRVALGQPLPPVIKLGDIGRATQNVFTPLIPASQTIGYKVSPEDTQQYLRMTGTSREEYGAPKSMFLAPAILGVKSLYEKFTGDTEASKRDYNAAIALALGKDKETGKIQPWESSYNIFGTIGRNIKGQRFLMEQAKIGEVERQILSEKEKKAKSEFYSELTQTGVLPKDVADTFLSQQKTLQEKTDTYNQFIKENVEPKILKYENKVKDIKSSKEYYDKFLNDNATLLEDGTYQFSDPNKYAAAEAMRMTLEPKISEIQTEGTSLTNEIKVLELEKSELQNLGAKLKPQTELLKKWQESSRNLFEVSQTYRTPYEQQLYFADRVKSGEGFLGLSGEQWKVVGSKAGAQIAQTMATTATLSYLPLGPSSFTKAPKDIGVFSGIGRVLQKGVSSAELSVPGSAKFLTTASGLGMVGLGAAGVYGRGVEGASQFQAAGEYKWSPETKQYEYVGIAQLPNWAKTAGITAEQWNKYLGGAIGGTTGAVEMYKAAQVASKGEFAFLKGKQIELGTGGTGRVMYLDVKPWSESLSSKYPLFSYTKQGGFGFGGRAFTAPGVTVVMPQGTSEAPGIFSKIVTQKQVLAPKDVRITKTLDIMRDIRPQAKARYAGESKVVDPFSKSRVLSKLPDEVKLELSRDLAKFAKDTEGFKGYLNAFRGEGPYQVGGSLTLEAKGLLKGSATRARSGYGDIDLELHGGGPKYAKALFDKYEPVLKQYGWKMKYNPSSGEIDFLAPGATKYQHGINVLSPDTPGAALAYTPFGTIQKPSELVSIKLADGSTIKVPSKAAVDVLADKIEAAYGTLSKVKGGKYTFTSSPQSAKSLADLSALIKNFQSQGLIAKGTWTRGDVLSLARRLKGLSISKGTYTPPPTTIMRPGASSLASLGASFSSVSSVPSFGYESTSVPRLESVSVVSRPSSISSTPSSISTLSSVSSLSSKPSSISSVSSLSGISSVSSASSISSVSSLSSLSSVSSSSSVSSLSGLGGWKMPTFGALRGGLPEGLIPGRRARGSYSWLVTNPIAPYAEQWLARQRTKTVYQQTGVSEGTTGQGYLKELSLKSKTRQTGSSYLASLGKANISLRGKV